MKQPDSRPGGFSLVELMVTVAIVAILASIAYPSYRGYVLRANRTVAKGALSEIASRQEGYFVDRKGYAGTLSALGYAAATLYLASDGTLSASEQTSSIYRISLSGGLTNTCPSTGTVSTTNYSILAVPVASQASDTVCGSLCLGASGRKLASGTRPENCWTR